MNSYTPKRIFMMLADDNMLFEIFKSNTESTKEINSLSNYDTRELSLHEFCKNTLKTLRAPNSEQIYILSGLISLFNEIIDPEGPKITMKKFTDYVVEKLIDPTDQTTAITNKYVSKQVSGKFKGLYNSKVLLDTAASVFGGSDDGLRRFEHDTSIHDHGRHNHGIKKIYYATQMKRIIGMDNVPKGLTIYSKDGYVE